MLPSSPLHGEHGWTKRAANGVVLEVLMTKKTVYVKKTDNDLGAASRSLHFNRFGGPIAAWEEAKKLSGWSV
jgi:hypothetical protein